MERVNAKIFCGVCRHPSHVYPGHMPDCPVYTQEPQRGNPGIPQGLYQDPQQIQQVQGSLSQMGQSATCPICGGQNGTHVWAGPGGCPATYASPQYGQSDTDTRILAELSSLRQELRALREQIDRLRQ